jgi:hypothetical protein
MFPNVSTLLMMVGFPNRPLSDGKGGFCRGSPAPALHRGHQGGFLAADESGRADADLDVEGESRISICFRPAVRGPWLLDIGLQPLDGQRVFGPHVHHAAAGPDGVPGDGHALNNQEGVASSRHRSMKAPGSPSSALQMTYF